MNPPVQQKLHEAARLHNAGRVTEAEAGYRALLADNPNHADALHLLGVASHQLGRTADGIDLIRRAIALEPRNPAYPGNLGVLLAAAGRLDEAAAAFERAAQLNPNFPEAFNNLGNARRQGKRPGDAVAAYRRAVALRPSYAEAHMNLGAVLQEQGKLDEAVGSYRAAITAQPNFAEAFNKLGTALQTQGAFDRAIAAYRRAIELDPTSVEAHGNLGGALGQIGRLDDAIVQLRHALALRPEAPELHSNLANVLRDADRLDEALDALNNALALNPDFAHALGTLGGVLKDRGQLDPAIAAYRRAVALSNDPKIYDSLLLTLHYHPDYDAKKLFEEHAEWERRYAAPLLPAAIVHDNDRSPDRPLRVGYVGDLSNSPVGRFLLPLLAHHDRASYEPHGYNDGQRPDGLTARLRSHSAVWRDVAGFTDARLAAQIREDRIDVLVDLAMHGGRNRLLVFARKPVPVQVTYLAYAGTTGLHAIDYRLTDPYLDPTDDDKPFYAERSVRLPATYWCYQPPAAAPDVGPLPASANGFITFGSLNRSAKVTPHAFAAWRQILTEVPGSRLVLHWGEGGHRDAARADLAAHGIDPARLQFVAALPFGQYLRQYNHFDIALDPFPYPGGTTTCDALWMGVPVVTLAGRTASSRGGLSILSNLGLAPELVAHSVEQYTQIATALARDPARIARLRSTLRNRMRASPLMDAPRFARDVEAALRRMWRAWC